MHLSAKKYKLDPALRAESSDTIFFTRTSCGGGPSSGTQCASFFVSYKVRAHVILYWHYNENGVRFSPASLRLPSAPLRTSRSRQAAQDKPLRTSRSVATQKWRNENFSCVWAEKATGGRNCQSAIHLISFKPQINSNVNCDLLLCAWREKFLAIHVQPWCFAAAADRPLLQQGKSGKRKIAAVKNRLYFLWPCKECTAVFFSLTFL
jgi:hypothetical protein